MKVIDLLNKIANGEEVPEKIKWGEHYLTWYVYEHKALDELGDPNIFECAGGGISCSLLNDEIEIIEDNKINKLDYCEENTLSNLKTTTYLSVEERQLIDSNFKTIKEKFDEIIDRLNGDSDDN